MENVEKQIVRIIENNSHELAAEEILRLFAVSGSHSAEDMSKAWSEGYHRKIDEINGNELRYFDVWLANYR